MSKKPRFDWPAWQAHLATKLPVLGSLREYLCEYFAWREEPPNEYERRPLLGLKLELPDDKTLAIRPAWHPPRKRYDREENGNVSRKIVSMGCLDCERITIDVLAPGKLLSLRLEPGSVNGTCVRLDSGENSRNLQAILDVAHDLLLDPIAVFSRQADHCCCCGKALTDVVSRTRGIGPECIKYMSWFESPPKITAVDRYRQAYYQDTGFLPGR